LDNLKKKKTNLKKNQEKMCGIVAHMGRRSDGEAKDPLYIIDATEQLSHRGPDFTGFAVVGSTLLGHTRLAIVDPDSGAQPIVREDHRGRRSGVTVNGEIYNHKTIRGDLGETTSFHSNCDCEVIGPAVARWGIAEACRRFDGVFAFVWANDEGAFAVARDPIGVNPLYYAVEDEEAPEGSSLRFRRRLWFASEIKAFEKMEGAPPPQLFPPGHYMDHRTAHPVPYYDFAAWDAIPTQTMDENYLASLLTNAVDKRLMADREIGVFLSGGLDSSLVAALVARHTTTTTRRRRRRVKSFSIGLPGSPDLRYAREVAEHIGTEHHEVTFTEEEGLRALPQVVRAIETIDTTSIRASTPMWLLAKYVSEHTDVKVLYSGEGADEALCGYLYFHNAPSPKEGRAESARRVRELHMYDNQRANKSTAAHGLEVRVPFLDLDLIHYVMSLVKPEGKLPREGVEKHALR
jgi:asparagine synthase (glutamine-hydrolysing)